MSRALTAPQAAAAANKHARLTFLGTLFVLLAHDALQLPLLGRLDADLCAILGPGCECGQSPRLLGARSLGGRVHGQEGPLLLPLGEDGVDQLLTLGVQLLYPLKVVVAQQVDEGSLYRLPRGITRGLLVVLLLMMMMMMMLMEEEENVNGQLATGDARVCGKVAHVLPAPLE
jgi:hypothetical protein